MSADTIKYGKDTRTDEEIIKEYTEFYQQECHKTAENIMKVTKKANYQDVTNVYLFRKLAELTLQVNRLKYPE